MLNKALAIVTAALTSHACLAQGPFNVGTVQPGDSIVIYYDVTINSPLVPADAMSISHQGTVSGSNFANVPTNDPASAAAGDATVTLLNTPLPVIFSEFKAFQKEHTVALTWKIVSEENALKYEVEKSQDAKVFAKIGEVMAVGRDQSIDYDFVDQNPFPGNNYYRLKVLDLDATFTFTRIVKVAIGEETSAGILYPNPVTGKTVNIELRNLAKGPYDVTFINTSGRIIYSKKIEHAGGSASQLITIPDHVASGIYSTEIKGVNMKIYKKLVIK